MGKRILIYNVRVCGIYGLPVLAEADLMAERFVAQLARKWSLAVVAPPGMHFKAVRRREHFLALYA